VPSDSPIISKEDVDAADAVCAASFFVQLLLWLSLFVSLAASALAVSPVRAPPAASPYVEHYSC
jgi:hypothetical protein